MKSPFLIFLPAALGAAGAFLLVQPGQREELLVEGGLPPEAHASRNPWGERVWGGTRPDRGSEAERLIPAESPEGDFLPKGRETTARKSFRHRERATDLATASAGPRPERHARPVHSLGELEWRAAQVEMEANRELERLIPALRLTEAQQQRIFAVLVRHSSAFDPLMQVEAGVGEVFPEDGSFAGATKDEELYAALEPGQQVVMEELYEDQSAWWQDVVDQLVPDSSIPGLAGVDPPIMADDKPTADTGEGKDVTGTVRPPSP